MFQDGMISLGAKNVLEGIRAIQTTTYSITLGGKIHVDGTCDGVQYSDSYGTWPKAIVQGVARITLRSSYVPVQLNTGRIILKSRTICLLKNGFCMDSEYGYSYWKLVPTTACDFHEYDVLFEGVAKFLEDAADPSSPVVYSLETQDTTFALTKTKELPIYGYILFHTEHPKLFILETRKGDSPLKRGYLPMENLDIFLYMNS